MFEHLLLPSHSKLNDIILKTEYENDKRVYVSPEGNRYKSITSLLSNLNKAAIQKWRANVGEKEANRISTKASRRGTCLHSLCEKYIKNEELTLTNELPHVVELFLTIKPFLNQINNVHLVEGTVWSDELGVAGRVDLIAEFAGKLSVVDYKTSSKNKTWKMCDRFFLQGTFYAKAYEEVTGIPVEQVVILIAVENNEPLLYVENRDSWLEPLKEVINKYN